MQRPASVPPPSLDRLQAVPAQAPVQPQPQPQPEGLAPAHPHTQSQPHRTRVPTDNSSSGWVTTTSSWASSGPVPDRPQPLAWAGVRHQPQLQGAGDGREEEGEIGQTEDPGASHCSQTVFITCLHLSHEMGLRDVGQYAWTTPLLKDPMGSMMKIMKEYNTHIRALSKHSDLNCRSAPDPSKTVIQHHLQRARLAAGQNSYVAVVYNGHGIQEPPTDQGELWCYDKGFDECLQTRMGPSEYIPIMLFDVMAWAGASTCYVWDCSYSGRIIRAAYSEAEEIDNQYRAAAAQNPAIAEVHPPVYARRQIHFAACGSGQTIPRVHGMPDDLFTACLTTPLRIALLFHNLQTFPLTKGDGPSYIQKKDAFMAALWENMSQSLKDRLWYELDAITHTIAWQTLEGREYQKLFGKSGDVVNNLASGFVLAQRVLGAYRTTPESIPSIPSSTGHALWTTWDLILDNLFEQLPKYFDEGAVDTTWEKGLRLVSFLADQLDSINTAGQSVLVTDTPRSGMTPGLTRLPIICAAAMTKTFRVQACSALDSCLCILDVRGLAHAVQGGALDVAAQLLSLEDPEIKAQMISIWSSLVRYDVAVLSLAKDGLHAEHLSGVPAVRFFLSALEESLGKEASSEDGQEDDDGSDSRGDTVTLVIQTAAVLSTIANYVRGRSAPRFVLRTLSMAGVMLKSSTELVKQWGALMIAEVLGSLDKPEEGGVTDGLKAVLLKMTKSNSVESRATAVYALIRWLPYVEGDHQGAPPRPSTLVEMDDALELAETLMPLASEEGSPFVRRELARMCIHILALGQHLTDMALWLYILRQAAKDCGKPAAGVMGDKKTREEIEGAIKIAGTRVGITPAQLGRMKALQRLLSALSKYANDPDVDVARVVGVFLRERVGRLGSGGLEGNTKIWDGIYQLTFPCPGLGPSTIGSDSGSESLTVSWTEESIKHVLCAAGKFDKSQFTQSEHGQKRVEKHKSKQASRDAGRGTAKGAVVNARLRSRKWNNELFEKHRLSLQAYLAAGRGPDPQPERVMSSQGVVPERTWTMRLRLLEDSLVVAEQQVGLPWNWEMKDVSFAEPRTTMACHSFHSTVMSCNGTHDILLWDWASSQKSGRIHLDLPPNGAITSSRFVNELHEQTVILAEINNGDVHILARPHDTTRIKPIACFPALDMPRPSAFTHIPDLRSSPSRALGDESVARGEGVAEPWERRMVTTWFRSSGLLCVGGISEKINVWDCPAERCVRTLQTESSSATTTLITEPVSGNLIFSGSSDGQVKLFDLRQARRTPLLAWRGDVGSITRDVDQAAAAAGPKEGTGRRMKKVGVVLGESKNVTTACSNGIVNISDLRRLSAPVSSTLVHPDGISGASFQAHSGLLSVVSKVIGGMSRIGSNGTATQPASVGTSPGVAAAAGDGDGVTPDARTSTCTSVDGIVSQMDGLRLPHGETTPDGHKELVSQHPDPSSVTVNFALLRTSLGTISTMTHRSLPFSSSVGDGRYEPYTAFHSLRPFVGVGYGRQAVLRGCGEGKGLDTDSGSYSFLRAQTGRGLV